ncbi:tRNA(Arg) A34 adenosine deaminase TadA [Mumia flava]|uniref:tRNA(Arg) A34 adenosine deaminase TadA n=1 Tax=Mumia flava TaxID=1348852 RepID=A0A0B2BEV0_9ACTN|nr:nucleoside deaminase [Mumia flava]PJJ53703.1 tRNA(Arg) A34 adenosine deaminase TadA [Mumia flava]
MSTLTATDLTHLRTCVDLARTALEQGDHPFGSVLVDEHGEVRFSDHNHVAGGDRTQHPELAAARWAAAHLSPEERRFSTVYTSGEHCPMCAAAHAWVGLGRIVYIVSSERLADLQRQWGTPESPVAPLPVNAVAPDLDVAGPVAELAGEIEAMYQECFRPS